MQWMYCRSSTMAAIQQDPQELSTAIGLQGDWHSGAFMLSQLACCCCCCERLWPMLSQTSSTARPRRKWHPHLQGECPVTQYTHKTRFVCLVVPNSRWPSNMYLAVAMPGPRLHRRNVAFRLQTLCGGVRESGTRTSCRYTAARRWVLLPDHVMVPQPQRCHADT